jgi:hypothetical protein
MYSADSSHSSIVAEMPRLSSTGFARAELAQQREVLHVPRADLKMSQYLSISSIWLMSMTSEISLRLCASAARAASAALFAVALEAVRGAARLERAAAEYLGARTLHAARRRLHCSSVSAEHGPAMTMTSSPPIRTSSIVTIVSSGWKLRLARLYGSVMRSTSCTPSRSRSAPLDLVRADDAQAPVRVTPDDGARPSQLDEARDHCVDLRFARPLVSSHTDHDITLRYSDCRRPCLHWHCAPRDALHR